jgi:hypothetical protein
MDDEDGDLVLPLHLAQQVEERRDVSRGILVAPVEPDERIEDEKPWLQSVHGVGEALYIVPDIESQARSRDHLYVELFDRDASRAADPLEAATNDVEGVFGGEEQDPAGSGDGEAPEARRARSDSDGQVEGEETLAHFGLASNNSDGLLAPESLDKPAVFFGLRREAMGRLIRE